MHVQFLKHWKSSVYSVQTKFVRLSASPMPGLKGRKERAGVCHTRVSLLEEAPGELQVRWQPPGLGRWVGSPLQARLGVWLHAASLSRRGKHTSAA